MKSIGFKLDHYIDFRKSKEFAYDFKAVRYLSTGSQFIVKSWTDFCICTATVQPAPRKHPVCSLLPLQTTLIRKYIMRTIRKNLLCSSKRRKLRICVPFKETDFSINYFEPVLLENPNTDRQIEKENNSRKELYRHLKFDSQSAGITVVAPNATWADQCYYMAKNRKLKIHRIDPILKMGNTKKGSPVSTLKSIRH